MHISIITYIEVYAYNFPDEAQKQLLDEVFRNLEIIGINNDVADQTIIYRKSKTRKIKLPDAIILATTRSIGADLITGDEGDFRNVDRSVNVINLESFRV